MIRRPIVDDGRLIARNGQIVLGRVADDGHRRRMTELREDTDGFFGIQRSSVVEIDDRGLTIGHCQGGESLSRRMNE